MADFEAFVTAWYWSGPDLRECIVVEATVLGSVTRSVLDAVTLEPVSVAPEDVLIKRPD